MIRHTVAFRFRPEVDQRTAEALLAQLRSFPALYPQMRNFTLGLNVSSRDGTFSHAFSAEFDDNAALEVYLTSDSHERFVQDQWRPVIEKAAIVSYEHAPLATDRKPLPTARPRAPFGMEYARIEVPDLPAAIDFLEYQVGLQCETRTDEYAYLRSDIAHHSIELIGAPERSAGHTTAIGYSVENDDVLESLQKRVTNAGLEVFDLQERQQGLCENGFAVRDPNGLIVELFTEFQEWAEPPQQEIRPVDLVHPFLATTRFQETLDFYQGVMGFLASDHIVGSTTFLRGEDRYHHSLAIQNNKADFVAHLCFAMKSLDHVMRLRARALYKGAPIVSDMVNHSASTSISFYLHDPAFGPRYEVCNAHRRFTPAEHETHRARRMTADPRNIDVWRPAADDWGRF